VTIPLQEAELAVEMMAIELLRPAEDNPRDTLGELAELTDSIEQIGVLQPLIVRPTGELGRDDAEIMLVLAGHRRLAAAILAERTHVPVIVRTDIDESDRQAVFFIENFHRLDLGPIERARALKQLSDSGVSQKDIGAKVGITQPTVSKWLALLKLPEKAQKWVAEGKLAQEDAVSLAALPTEKATELCADGVPPDWRIRNAKSEVEDAKKRAAAEKTAKERGWRILAEDPDLFQQLGLEGDDEAVALDDDRDDPRGLLAHVNPIEHVGEPCHAVFIGRGGELRHACTDPSRHPRPEGWKSPREIEMAEAVATGLDGSGRKLSKYEVERAKRSAARDQILTAIAPIKALCTSLLATDVEAKSIVDFGVLAMLEDEDSDPRLAGDLLGLKVDPYNADGLVEAIRGEGAIDGLKVLHAWGLAYGLTALEALAFDVSLDRVDTDEIAWYMPASRRMLEHLGGLCEFDPTVPTLEEFLLACHNLEDPEVSDREEPTVEVYTQRGKYKRRCSECGDLDGQNTEEELANERAVQHLKEKHGIEVAA